MCGFRYASYVRFSAWLLTVTLLIFVGCGGRSNVNSSSLPSGSSSSLTITTVSLPNGQLNTPYSAALAVTGGSSPYTWSITSGSLLAGLSLNSSSGLISGTPSAAVTNQSLTFMVTDSSHPPLTASISFTLNISAAPLVITTSSLPSGSVNGAYSAALAATGGTTPYTWTIVSGTLPAGLSLSGSSGAITGIPSAPLSNDSVTFMVTDSSHSPLTATENLKLTITVASSITVTVSPARAAIALGEAVTLTATINDSAGVSWTTSNGGSFSSRTSLSGNPVIYTPPRSAGPYTVTASSVTDPAQGISAQIYVTDLAGVYTYHDDLARDGLNAQEYALSTSSVNTSTFGKLFSCPVDGAIYGQPLWVANLTVNGLVHNVVFVATQHDSLFAFDADANPCVLLWSVSLVDIAHGGDGNETSVPSAEIGFGNGDIMPEVGVTGTPVIDPVTNTLYVVSKSVDQSGPTIFQRLHAIDITTGNEEFGGPASIDATITFPGTGDGGSVVTFNPQQENQRAGLALVNGIVYVGWASHEESLPFYGWLVGFSASTLGVTSILNVSPNVQEGGIWMGGAAPSADSNNNLYLITGNATFDVTNSSAPNNDFGDSFLQITGGSNISSYFTPSDQASDAANDFDFGAGGAALVVNLASGPVQHVVIGGGKDGTLYALNGDNMGGSGDSNALQNFNLGYGIFATSAFWNNNLYIAGSGGPLMSFSFDPSTPSFNTSPASVSPAPYGFPGSPSVSASGTTNGIVWALDNLTYCTPGSPSCGPVILHAYDATNVGQELWNSSQVPADAAGNAVKFSVPTVANGKVYIGTRGDNSGGDATSSSTPGELDVYGLKPN